jgi:hypothetical protein
LSSGKITNRPSHFKKKKPSWSNVIQSKNQKKDDGVGGAQPAHKSRRAPSNRTEQRETPPSAAGPEDLNVTPDEKKRKKPASRLVELEKLKYKNGSITSHHSAHIHSAHINKVTGMIK